MARSAEAILIVLDVGPNVGKQITSNQKSFLANAQHCATMIILRKIFACSKDEIGLILLGSEETNNPLADDDGYQNIEIAHSLELPTWKMIQTISSYKTYSPVDGDWLDALIVAVDFMKTSTEGKKYKQKKIVMFTNFCSNVSDDEVNCVIQGIKSEELDIVVIGPHLYSSDSQGATTQEYLKSEDQEEGEKLIARIISETNGVICSFEDAIPQLVYFEQRKVRPTPWKVTLDIGSHIRIPVVGYKKTSEVKRPDIHNVIVPSKPTPNVAENQIQAPPNDSPSLDCGHQPIKSELDDDTEDVTFVDRDLVYQTRGDGATPVDPVDIIEGYLFGSTLVPVTDDDKPHLMYQSGPKCFSVLGFTKRVNISSCLLKGKGCYQFFPEKEENSMRAFSALIQAMHSKAAAAIVRRVYNNNNNPVIGALFPYITPVYQCLVYIELPYSEDVVPLLFPPLVNEKNKPTKEQLDAVDQLITSMDLMKADENDDGEAVEAYKPTKVLDPSEQQFYHVVAKKVLDGGSYISGSYIHEAVQQLLTPKEDLVQAAKPALRKIKEIFPLTEIKPKEGARKAAIDVFQQLKPSDGVKLDIVNQPSGSSDIKDIKPFIGTLNPQEDFMNIINQGIPLRKACDLMKSVITDMISKAFDADDFNKPYKALLVMRKVCVERDPSVYNDWVVKFKKELADGKSDFWKLLVDDHAGLITSLESKQSPVSDEEARKFLLIEEEESAVVAPQSMDEDLDDLINQM